MKRHVFVAGAPANGSTPVGVVGRGLIADLAGTLVLSLLARALPGMGARQIYRTDWARGGSPNPNLVQGT